MNSAATVEGYAVVRFEGDAREYHARVHTAIAGKVLFKSPARWLRVLERKEGYTIREADAETRQRWADARAGLAAAAKVDRSLRDAFGLR